MTTASGGYNNTNIKTGSRSKGALCLPWGWSAPAPPVRKMEEIKKAKLIHKDHEDQISRYCCFFGEFCHFKILPPILQHIKKTFSSVQWTVATPMSRGLQEDCSQSEGGLELGALLFTIHGLPVSPDSNSQLIHAQLVRVGLLVWLRVMGVWGDICTSYRTSKKKMRETYLGDHSCQNFLNDLMKKKQKKEEDMAGYKTGSNSLNTQSRSN